MTGDTLTLIGLGVGAVVILWLVFSVMKKVFGFLLLGAIAFGAWMLWNNPDMRDALTGFATGLLG
jgi:uncharacterized membrane protein YccC